jgi:phosphatidylinositol kinase/protein kinase (PI-3  family)
MFIIIIFGYKFKKIFTIDCLAAALFDCIWDQCYKQLKDTYELKEQLFTKEITNHQKKIET